MENLINYSEYDIQHFVGDTSFRKWVLNPSPKLDIFWKDFILNNPEKEIIIAQASKLLISIKFVEELPSENLVEDSLKKALLTILQRENKTPVISFIRRWWAVAAVLFVAISGTIYFLTSNSADKVKIAQTLQPTLSEIAPGGNIAILTLSDGSVVYLDSAKKGVISIQEGSDVIKLANGQIAYTNRGEDQAGKLVYNTITTPKGGQYQVTLSDGSKVWLNAASSIKFPTDFSITDRNVTITGEVYFEVAHEVKRPFRVNCRGIEIEVLGTSFNVNAYEDEPAIRTTLLQGSVNVKKGEKNLLIKPGEQAMVSMEEDIRLAGKVNIEEVMAWKNGKFIFQDESLGTVIRKLKRWYDIEMIVQEGKETDDVYVGVISRYVPLSSILNMLEKTGTARFAIKGKTLIVK